MISPQDEGIHDLVLRNAREMIGGDIAEGIAEVWIACICHRRQLRRGCRVRARVSASSLAVLARAEVAVARDLLARICGEFFAAAQSTRAVGNGDAQHRRVTLDVEAVAQPQRAETRPPERLAGRKALRLSRNWAIALVNGFWSISS